MHFADTSQVLLKVAAIAFQGPLCLRQKLSLSQTYLLKTSPRNQNRQRISLRLLEEPSAAALRQHNAHALLLLSDEANPSKVPCSTVTRAAKQKHTTDSKGNKKYWQVLPWTYQFLRVNYSQHFEKGLKHSNHLPCEPRATRAEKKLPAATTITLQNQHCSWGAFYCFVFNRCVTKTPELCGILSN